VETGFSNLIWTSYEVARSVVDLQPSRPVAHKSPRGGEHGKTTGWLVGRPPASAYRKPSRG